MRAKWPIRPELIPVSVAWSDQEYFYSPLDGGSRNTKQLNHYKIYQRRVRSLPGAEERVYVTNLLFPRSFVLLFSIVLRQLCLLHQVRAASSQFSARSWNGLFIYAFICHQSSCYMLYMSWLYTKYCQRSHNGRYQQLLRDPLAVLSYSKNPR